MALGLLLLPTLGLQYDEVFFARALLSPKQILMRVSAGSFSLPLMLLSYVGALKSWLYLPLFAVSGYGVASIRIPALVLAAITLVILGRLLLKISGRIAALFIVWMLGTDVTFLVTSVYDWGPVVLQNLLLACGLLCIVAWSQKRRDWLLFAAGAAFGLASWDKALFLWNLSAMSLVLLLLQWRHLASYQKKRRILFLASAGLLAGAMPLIVYNATHRGSTLHANTHLSMRDIGSKFDYLLQAIDGKIATMAFSDFRYPAIDHIQRPFDQASRETAKASAWMLSSWYFSSWRLWLIAVLSPIGLFCADWPQRKWILFFLASATLAWIQSALTIGAGRSLHHAVLIWPLLYAGIALSAGAVAQRVGRYGAPVLFLVTAVLVLRGLMLVNSAYSNILSFSPIVQFSNADEALVTFLETTGASRVVTIDWGIANLIAVRSQGAIKVQEEDSGAADRSPILRDLLACKAPACVVVTHPDAREIITHVNEFLRTSLCQNHLVAERVREIDDSHGTPTFEVFRLRPEN
jgi:hypothetical protein